MLRLIMLPVPWLPPLLLAYATLTGGLVIHALWGQELVLASTIGLCIPAMALRFVSIAYSPAGAEAELSRERAQEAEVTGTLRWEKEGAALVAERSRVYEIVEEKRERFPIAVIAASTLVAVGSSACSFMVAAYRRTLGQGMLIRSVLSVVPAILAVGWFEFWR